MITINGVKKPIPIQEDTDCCKKAVTKTTIKGKKTITTKECEEFIFGLEEKPVQQAPGNGGGNSQIADPTKRFALPNTAPGMAGDRFNMYAMIYNQYLIAGQTLDTYSYFENYNDHCMNTAPHSAYYHLDVSVPNSEGISNVTKDKLDGFNYYNYTNPSFVLNYQPRQFPPYYTAKFYGRVYVFVQCWNESGSLCSQADFDAGNVGWCDYNPNCYLNLDSAKQCAQQYDAKNLPGCDYKGRYCKKYEGSAEIPFSLSCNQNFTAMNAWTPDPIAIGATYPLTCTYGKSFSNSNQVSAYNNSGSLQSTGGCQFDHWGDSNQKIAVFSCKVADSATENSTVTSSCVMPSQESTGWLCDRSVFRNSTVTCGCSNSTCAPIVNSCGITCPVTRTDCGVTSCIPTCGNTADYCGKYNDLSCNLLDYCTGTKPKDQCPVGWKECSSGSTDCTN